jgi:hypothetical protein
MCEYDQPNERETTNTANFNAPGMRNNRKNSIIIFNNIRRDKGSLHKHDM